VRKASALMESNRPRDPVDAGTGAKPTSQSDTPLGNTWELLEAAVQRAKTQSDFARDIERRMEVLEARIISVEVDARARLAVIEDAHRSSADMSEKCRSVVEQSTNFCTESFVESLLAQRLDQLRADLVQVLTAMKREAEQAGQMKQEADLLYNLGCEKSPHEGVVLEETTATSRLLDMVKKLQDSNACLIACTTQQRELMMSMSKQFEDDIKNIRQQLDRAHIVPGNGSTSGDTSPAKEYSPHDGTTTSAGSCSPHIEADDSSTEGFAEASRNQGKLQNSSPPAVRGVLGMMPARKTIPSVAGSTRLQAVSQPTPPMASIVCAAGVSMRPDGQLMSDLRLKARGRSASSHTSVCDISEAGNRQAQASNGNISRAEKWFQGHRSGSHCSVSSDRADSEDHAIPSSAASVSAASVQSSAGVPRGPPVLSPSGSLRSLRRPRSPLRPPMSTSKTDSNLLPVAPQHNGRFTNPSGLQAIHVQRFTESPVSRQKMPLHRPMGDPKP